MLLAGFLVVLAGILASGNGNRCNNKTDIELYDPSDNSKYHCWRALDCHDGQEPSVEPGSVHPDGTDVHCKPCQEGVSYSNGKTNYRCRKCTTCGKKVVRLTCTISKDRLCDNKCISKKFYFNATDHQCYPCTECCGANNENIESQCLSSKTVRIGLVIGEKGALHCKVLSSQQCDELPKNNVSSVPWGNNNTGAVEKKCNESKNNVIPNNSNAAGENISERKSTCSKSALDTLHIALIILVCCLTFVISIGVAVHVFRCYKREREMQSPRNESCLCFGSCFFSSAGQGCRDDCERLISTFQERVKFIPEDVKINSIPYEVEDHIKKLDAKQPQSKNWYDVGRKLGVSNDDLNFIKREDDRPDGSPTLSLLSKLSTWEHIISLRKFVQVLHDLKRNDIANLIIEFYKQPATTNDTNV